MLAEAGFIAIFLGNASVETSFLVILAFRWIVFRMMLGSAIVKLRGGEEWRTLDALKTHFESQPFPGPLSWKIHSLPDKVLEYLTVLIQLPMLFLPFIYFMPQPFAAIAGILTIVFQILIFVSGNYAWLNLITAVLALSTLNDSIVQSITGLATGSASSYPYSGFLTISMILLAIFSINPILNFFSRKPAQNTSYNPFNVGNSYGAFPKVMEKHFEIGIEGEKNGEWKEYELHSSFREKDRKPVQIAPNHHMLEYILYFYVNEEIEQSDWLNRLLEKTLEHEGKTLTLYRSIPFQKPPERVRAVKYRYEFTDPEEKKQTGNYWKREKKEVLHTVN
ncbi:lipase maturation factor family protein [Candidatus Nanohalobium constans]|nr:lipase maturation factor family protein [Candidatus Nanohalobium constans]